MNETEFNAALKRLGVFGASGLNLNAKRGSMFGKLHLIREKERTSFCGAGRPRGMVDRAEHVPFDGHLCAKCRQRFEAFAASSGAEIDHDIRDLLAENAHNFTGDVAFTEDSIARLDAAFRPILLIEAAKALENPATPPAPSEEGTL